MKLGDSYLMSFIALGTTTEPDLVPVVRESRLIAVILTGIMIHFMEKLLYFLSVALQIVDHLLC
jgi:hypothetical protein